VGAGTGQVFIAAMKKNPVLNMKKLLLATVPVPVNKNEKLTLTTTHGF
jgi:hypothetical protein